MRDDRAAVYREPTEDGGTRTIFRASSLGHCERALAACLRGLGEVPYPDFMYERFAEGNTAEKMVQARFVEDHPEFATSDWHDQHVIELEVAPNVVIRGHLDRLHIFGGDRRVVEEDKALGRDWFNRFVRDGIDGLPGSYPWQIAAYMIATGGTGVLVGALKDKNGEVTSDSLIHVVELDAPPRSAGELRDRCLRVMELAESPTWLDDSQCSAEFLCHYPYLHDDDEQWELLDGSDAAAVDLAGEMYLKAARLEREAKQLKASGKVIAEEWVGGVVAAAVDQEAGGGNQDGSAIAPSSKDNRLRVRTEFHKMTWIEDDVPERTSTTKAHVRRYPKFSEGAS